MNQASYKNLCLNLLLLLSPLFFFGQTTLTGLWVGTVHNDSASIRKDQSFEIALTEKNGKVTGFTRNEFIVNDTLYYIVKRVKGTIEGNTCVVTDFEVVSYNFPGKLDKGITVSSTFYQNPVNNAWKLDSWKTNVPRKKYYAVGGKMDMETEKDLTVSKLFAHLEELNKADEVAFYKERKEEQNAPVVRILKPERIQTEYTDKLPEKMVTDLSVRKPELPALVKVDAPVITKKEEEVKPLTNESINSNPVLTKTTEINTPAKTITAAVNSEKQTETNPINGAAINNETSKVVIPIAVTDDNNKTATTADKVAVNTNPASGKTERTEAVAPIVKQTEKVIGSQPVKQTTTQQNEITKTSVNKPVIPVSPKQNETTKPVVTEKPVTSKPAPAVTTVVQKAQETKNTNSLALVQTSVNKENEVIPAITNKTVTASPLTESKPVLTYSPTSIVVKNPGEDPIKKSAVIAGRKSEFTQEIQFKSDSLTLTLYDNGEIDGDTVSVFLNGEVVMPSQGLKSSAIRKTIHLPHDVETFTLVMFAESLGKYPPNTGLLVIRDGNDIYNLRFSSDFSKSAGIVFRKKKE